MASKRPLEQPAPYDSSSDDDLSESDAVGNEEEEEEEQQVEEKNGSENGVEKFGDDIDEEDEEEEDMEEDEKVKSPVKKKKPTVSRPNDSDNSPPRSPSLAGFTVEPTMSMSKPKKKAPAAEPNNQREREPDEKDSSKKKKKRKVAFAEDPKKASGVAVVMWSEEDEIALLKGMSHFKSKKGTDPNADMGAFHDFIKEKLNPDITKYKLSEKIRRLKKKYLNNASKIEGDDEDPIFPKPHELRSFQLSKKIWGTDKKDESMSNKKKKESIPTRTPIPIPIPIPIPTTPKTLTKTTAAGKLSEMYPYLYKSLEFCSMDESIDGISKMMPLMGSSVLEGLDRNWKKLEIVEVECFLRKTELINEQGKLLLDILKNM